MPRNDSPPRGQGAPGPAHASLVEILDRPAVSPVAEPVPSPAPAAPELTPADDAAPHAGDGTPPPEPSRGAEIELKLVTDAAHFPVFRDAPVIAANARNRGVRRHLRAIYYDTADRRLRKAGLVLRVRQSGSRITQCVKTDYGSDSLRRGEWEAAVPTLRPELALALPLLPEKLRAKLAAAELEPVFTTDIHRHTRLVKLPTGTVEVAFDHGEIRAGDTTLPVAEIELELKDGSPHTLYDIALRLLEHGPLTPSLRTKSDRGFGLADGVPPTAPRPERLDIDPGAPVDAAFALVLKGALLHLLRALPAAEHGVSPEGVHQARVALRRLRSVLGLLRTLAGSAALESFAAEARWLAGSFGAARDCDIFVGETLTAIAAALPEIDGFAGLDRVAGERRREGYAAARAAIASERASRFMLELGGWIEGSGWRSDASAEALAALGDPAIAFAGRTLADLHARVIKRGRHFASMTPAERHKLRIAVKKLRYAADFLMPLYGTKKPVKRFATALEDLQEELGRYNDMATTRTIMAGFAADPAGRSPAAGAVIGWQAQALVAAEPRLRAAWRRFREVRPPWPAETPD
jgi:inorganic triphosphatase YgiF